MKTRQITPPGAGISVSASSPGTRGEAAQIHLPKRLSLICITGTTSKRSSLGGTVSSKCYRMVRSRRG